MKRMALLVVLVLVLAPAAWGFQVTYSTLYTPVYGPQAEATVGTNTAIGSPTVVPDLSVYKHYDALAENGTNGATDYAKSDWVAKIYNPVVTWGPGGVGKTTAITQEINVSMLLSFVDPYVFASAGKLALLKSYFSVVQEDLSTTPEVSLVVSTTNSGTPLTSGPNASVEFYHPTFGIFGHDTGLPVDIIGPYNNASGTYDASAAGITNLQTYADDLGLYLNLSALLGQTSIADTSATDPTGFASNIIVTETLYLTEPGMINQDVAVIPVPPSLILFGTGLLGLGFIPCLRRRS